MKLSKEQVLAFLPHRDPFLFIDSVEKIELATDIALKDLTPKDLVNSQVTASFKITNDMVVLQGHFPGNPIVPGVVQIEMIAQASAFISYPLTLAVDGNLKVETVLLTVDKTKFRKMLKPESQITIRSKMVRYRSGMATYEGIIEQDSIEVASASFLAKITITKE